MRIFNKKARHDYQLLEDFEAGIALSGSEVKSIKMGRTDLSSSFVRIRDSEAWLVGANIPPYNQSPEGYDPLRTRKLLLHKNEITALNTRAKQQNLTLIPTLLYTKGRLVKIRVALAKGKRQYEKREVKKRKDIEREIQRNLRG